MTEKVLKITKNQKTVFFVAFFSLLFVLASYLFFVSQIAFNVSERSVIENELSVLGAEISGLEYEYINMRNSVDLEFAYSLGFENASELQYITRRSLGQADSETSLQ